jgi:sugar O-acyltransferase (sialic acid O-acetyltransferase NeuD family)
MSLELYLVGAGGFGRDVASWLHMATLEPDTVFKGFLDTNRDALSGYDFPVGVVGDEQTWDVRPHHRFVCTLGSPALKQRVVRALLERGARFANVVSRTAIVSAHARVGSGCVIGHNAGIACHAHVGDFVTIVAASAIGHDAVIGDYSHISSFCDVTGHVTLGRGVTLGSHAVVLPRVTVGDYGIVGAGSVAVRDVPAGATVFGVPAALLWLRQGEPS